MLKYISGMPDELLVLRGRVSPKLPAVAKPLLHRDLVA
jgi:hypothetical protein